METNSLRSSLSSGNRTVVAGRAGPLGGPVFGYVGDRIGRKAALTLSVLLMAIPTFLVGSLPDTSHIGIAAPVIMVPLRRTQGLSVEGEYTAFIAYYLILAALISLFVVLKPSETAKSSLR